jgi:hypothetical protein
MKLIFSTLLLLCTSIAQANEVISNVDLDLDHSPNHSSVLLGHNLTPTSYTTQKGQVLAGAYEIAYGITDQLMVGTSPWMIIGYNMPMVNFKYGFTPDLIFDHASIETMYFKTFSYGWNRYKQESTWLRLTGTNQFSSNYSLHTSFGFQYAFTDVVSFSMRPPPLNNTPITLSLSALQEIHFSKNVGMFAESGLLGFNFPNRYLHVGASGFWQWATGYIQLGLSKTFQIGPQRLNIDSIPYNMWQGHQWKISEGKYSSTIYYASNEPFHPEIHIQFQI